MAVYKRGDVWWYEFIFYGQRIRESAKTPSKTVAKEAEKSRRRELEKTLAGVPAEKREDRIRTVSAVVAKYSADYPLTHRPGSVEFSRKRLKHVVRLLGARMLPDVTEDVVRDYIRVRISESASGRTINMELGELSRAIGKDWSVLWPKVSKLEERKDVGRALSPEEEKRLLDALTGDMSPNRSPMLGTILRVGLLTGMRIGEVLDLTWARVNFETRMVTVGRSKTEKGTNRDIPMNASLFAVLSAHAEWFTQRFGATMPEHFLFPFGSPQPLDPTRRVTDISNAWEALRKRAGVACRIHDLRHTVATKMAEAGVPEETMKALLGHMSRAMLERYSHIRTAAKRQAVESLTLADALSVFPTKIPTADQPKRVN